MTLDTNLGQIIIENNTFNYGAFTPDGGLVSSTTTYKYDWCIFSAGDFIITNNYLSGINTGGTNIQINGSAIITDNMFIRGATVVASYINANTHDSIIVNNIFDSFTVDGSNENLVTGLTPTSTYYANKNQTGYMPIYKFANNNGTATIIPTPNVLKKEYNQYVLQGTAGEGLLMNYLTPFVQPVGATFQVANGSSTVGCTGFNVPGVPADILSLYVQFNDEGDFYLVGSPSGSGSNVSSFTLLRGTSPALTPYEGLSDVSAIAKFYRNIFMANTLPGAGTPANAVGQYFIPININDLLPTNVQILSLVVGVYALSGSTNITGGTIELQATTSQSSQYSLSSLNGTIVDVKTSSDSIGTPGTINSIITIGSGVGQTTPATLASSTQYLTLDTSSLGNFVTGKDKTILVLYFISINMSIPGSLNILDSPIAVRYRW
jgi:hypothetical protein